MAAVDVPFPPLVEARLVGRPNRFVIEATGPDGTLLRAHTNNTGTMRSCLAPGSPVYLSKSDNPKRKLKYTLRAVRVGGVLIGVDTSMPMKAFVSAMSRDGLPEFSGYRVSATEVRVGKASRLDVLLERNGVPAYVELKNVSLQENGKLYFPDAVTTRGAKHLRELMRLREETGTEAYAVFIVQRPDGDALYPADHIDPAFGDTLRAVAARGVVPLAYRAVVTLEGVRLSRRLPVIL